MGVPEREGDGGAPLPLPSPAAQAIEGVQQQWDNLAGKYKLILATSLSFVICNMDKGGCWPGCCLLGAARPGGGCVAVGSAGALRRTGHAPGHSQLSALG